MNIKKLSQVWNYFKKGRGELGLVLSLYSMLLSYSIKFDVDFTITQYVVVTIIFFIGCSFLGVFLAEKVEPENQRISPYAQDGIRCALHFQRSNIYYYEGDIENAVKEMSKAINIRKQWLKDKDYYKDHIK